MNQQEQKKLAEKVLKSLEPVKDQTVVLGISGGADSVFLWHFIQQMPCKVILAHVNHHLRGEKSDQDQNFVESLGKNVEIDHFEAGKKNLENAAREFRYQFFQQLAKKHQAKYIITAHHADDNLESMLLHLSRGANLEGLLGIIRLHKNIFRPLINISKSEITAYLKAKSIPYREDATNQDTKYKRNLMRHQVLPALREVNPNVAKTVAQNNQSLREIHQYLQTQARTWIKNNCQNQKFSRPNFLEQHPALQKQILMEIHRQAINDNLGIQSINLQEVLTIIYNNIGNKKKQLGKLSFSVKNQLISYNSRARKS